MSPNNEAQWPGDVHVYSYDEIPASCDLFLIGEAQMADLKREWRRYVATPESQEAEHPNRFLKYRYCSISSRNSDSCELKFAVNLFTRWHDAIRVLPRSAIVACVHWWNYGKRPYLIVSQEWLDELRRPMFSLYALIDVIGIKKLVERRGLVDAAQLRSLSASLDCIAREHCDHAFLSFADSVLIKKNWSADAGDYEATYQPEQFLGVIGEVRSAIATALELGSYAVITQGSNWSTDDAPMRISEAQNHVVFASLGTPFAELIDIDRAVSASIKAEVHPKRELYLSESFMASLRFVGHTPGEELRRALIPFESRVVAADRRSYLPIDVAELLRRLQPRRATDPMDSRSM